MYDPTTPSVAFHETKLVGSGALSEVARAVREYLDADGNATVLVFDAITSRPIDLDLRGTPVEVVERLIASQPEQVKRGPGRPRLGVVAREVTLLPRHWEWLAAQPGGASVTLRKLVEEARKSGAGETDAREARDAAYRFMYAVAGNEADFEEVSRALYAGDRERFEALTQAWPADVRNHLRKVASAGLE